MPRQRHHFSPVSLGGGTISLTLRGIRSLGVSTAESSWTTPSLIVPLVPYMETVHWYVRRMDEAVKGADTPDLTALEPGRPVFQSGEPYSEWPHIRRFRNAVRSSRIEPHRPVHAIAVGSDSGVWRHLEKCPHGLAIDL